MSFGGAEILILLVAWVLIPAVALVALYWVIRLAVRAALRDAAREPGAPGR